jgi:tetratricopeptide (TPR) repeat protein
LHNLGAIIERQGQLQRAASLYLRALAVMPEHRDARFKLGRIYVHQRRYAEAITEFEKLQEPVQPDTPGFMYALAATHARAGHRQAAVDLMRRARQRAEQYGQKQLILSINRDLTSMGVSP